MADNTPLDINLNTSEAKTTFPLIADGQLVRWRLNNLSQSSSDKGVTLKFEYDLVGPAPSSEGITINPGEPGAKFFENIQLYAKPDAKDPQWFVKKLATRLDALLGTGDPGNAKGKPSRPNISGEVVPQLLGKELVAKMKVKTGEYVGNEFSVVYFPGDIAA